jgi:thiol-disulfide isomerase/thioredoxin
MKPIALMALGLALSLTAVRASAAELKPVDEAGYAKLLAASKGKVILVNFWATYCVPCRKEMPQLVALESKLRARGFQFVTISADEPEQQGAAGLFLDRIKVPSPAYIRKAKDDDKFTALVDQKWDGALPALFLYDRQGRKVKSFFGGADLSVVSAAIEKLL